jgi:hypothetical protein
VNLVPRKPGCDGYHTQLPHGIAAHHPDLCRSFGAEPQIHKRGQPRGSGFGGRRWPVERSNAWVPENRLLALRYDRLSFIIQSLLQAACIFLVAGRLAREFRQPAHRT